MASTQSYGSLLHFCDNVFGAVIDCRIGITGSMVHEVGFFDLSLINKMKLNNAKISRKENFL